MQVHLFCYLLGKFYNKVTNSWLRLVISVFCSLISNVIGLIIENLCTRSVPSIMSFQVLCVQIVLIAYRNHIYSIHWSLKMPCWQFHWLGNSVHALKSIIRNEYSTIIKYYFVSLILKVKYVQLHNTLKLSSSLNLPPMFI